MTHKEIYEALLAGKHIGHTTIKLDAYLDESGNLVGRPFDYDLENLVVKAPWYERIPPGGVLCIASDFQDRLHGRDGSLQIIFEYDPNNVFNFRSSNHVWSYARPVKKSEIQFLEDFQ